MEVSGQTGRLWKITPVFITGPETWTVQPVDCLYSDYAASAPNGNKLTTVCKEVSVTYLWCRKEVSVTYFKVQEGSVRDIL